MSRPVMPGSLRWGFWLWIVVSGLLALSAATIYLQALTQRSNPASAIGFAGLLVVVAVLQVVFALRLPRGKRVAREMLTTIGLIGGVPLFFRGLSSIWVVAVLMIVAVALLWLPASSRFILTLDPKPGSKVRR
ncbi:hypothetical protein [Arthrobacter roseus]|uniref:hypothetical protein n=1 Tax=Arthrobacter roseus TaxID=136274 RepID=UPI0019661132|nr:hypothetical protein [Arthrobacter roseus]MBM7849390.1 magnesium-transporting ATPase (P-type) [Arthrobacter roseus]